MLHIIVLLRVYVILKRELEKYYILLERNKNIGNQILRVIGSDYAGFYQEEMRYKLAAYFGCDVSVMSMIFYAPLVVEWSGVKMSYSFKY